MTHPTAWLLTDEHINHIQVDSVNSLIARAKRAHFVDVVVRINGKDERYQADWIKHMQPTAAAQEALKAAEERAERNARDAERYRYLHGRADACALADFSFNKGDAISGEWIIVKQDVDAGDAMDAAIDAAIAAGGGEMTLQERLRDWQSVRMKPVELAHFFALACEAADALDAKDARIRELEGALREILRIEDSNGMAVIGWYDAINRAREALK